MPALLGFGFVNAGNSYWEATSFVFLAMSSALQNYKRTGTLNALLDDHRRYLSTRM